MATITITITNDDGKVYAKYDTNKVLWQVLAKEHIGEDMTNKEWLDLISQNNKGAGFSDEVSRLGREFVDLYEPTKFS